MFWLWLRRLLSSGGAGRPARAERSPAAEEQARLVDAFIDTYVVWREQCAEVQRAYDRWIAGRDQREPAFSAYTAELDSEERCARAYRHCSEQLAGATSRWRRESLTYDGGIGVRREPHSRAR
jgi:hypothetical protein